MTADPGADTDEGGDRSTERLALLREIELKIDELRSVESRLGTPAEQAADPGRARDLAHRINNLLTAYRLSADLGDGAPEI